MIEIMGVSKSFEKMKALNNVTAHIREESMGSWEPMAREKAPCFALWQGF